jgi:hypothetical protein
MSYIIEKMRYLAFYRMFLIPTISHHWGKDWDKQNIRKLKMCLVFTSDLS